MSSIGIAELTALGAAPASGDLLVCVDVSDLSQSLAGSTKNLTIANLFTAPTITTSLTVTGTMTVSSTLNVVGNFSVATNKFTVAAASGNTVVAGTLTATGELITKNAAMTNRIYVGGSTDATATGIISLNNVTTLNASQGLFGGTSGQINLNTPTGGSILLSVNGTAAITVASTSAVTLASTLAVTGAISGTTEVLTANANVLLTHSATGTSSHYIRMDNTSGLLLYGIEGTPGGVLVTGSSAYDAVINNFSNTNIRFGVNNAIGMTLAPGGVLTAVSTITGTRHIGGTDIASAIAPGTFSDGTAPANNAYSSANVFSLLVSKTVSATTGSVVTSEVYHKQTGANSAGSTIASFSYIDSAHTSGTTLINIAHTASVEATGNGGTTTTLGCYRSQALIGTGATVTVLPLFDARPPANSGAIGTAYAFRSGAMDTATVNWGIYLGSSATSGGSTFRDTALATTATVGHLFIPSCAGAPTGVPSNIPTGQIAMHFDSTNNFLYAYLNGAWKKTTVFA